jgi:Kdo2-lipid IVA lauroyltransferase/acyltransferase
MTDLTYSFRISRRSVETTYRLAPHGLTWGRARDGGSVPYRAIVKVQTYRVRFLGSRKTYWRCDLFDLRGQRIRLQAAHCAEDGRIEDRAATYMPFVERLKSRIAGANSAAVFVTGRHWLASADAVVGWLLIAILRSTRMIGFDAATRTAAWLMCRVGPYLRGHRVARENLVLAYPDKSSDEIERILVGMWNNVGRVFVEYGYLAELWDFERGDARSGRIQIEGDDRRRYLAAMQAEGPGIVFGAHLANWELPIWALGAHPRETAIVYRPSNIAVIDRELSRIRARSGARLIPASPVAPFAVVDVLQRRGGVGMIVDEYFPRGVNVTFFGQPYKASPVFARFARRFDCPILGCRAIRLPGGRFRIQLTDALPAPRDAIGKIDVEATTQMIINVIEGWVREHPEQWLWIQRRWHR